jgi:hypothetical protein
MFDNLMLGTGAEGAGKSELLIQVLKNLDPGFTIDRVHLRREPFLAQAATLRPGSAIDLDEALFNKRKAMHSSTIGMLDWLQICRGQRLHIGMNFPHVDLLDDAIEDFRVRYRLHVPQRGLFQVMLRREWPKKGKVLRRWVVEGQFTYKPLRGPFKIAYDAKKDANMREFAQEASSSPGAPPRHLDAEAAAQALRTVRGNHA